MNVQSNDKNIEQEIKPLDVWNIIETYFRDNPNYKSQHQIDSLMNFDFKNEWYSIYN